MGWLGKKNGELLGLIIFNGFDYFVTIKIFAISRTLAELN